MRGTFNDSRGQNRQVKRIRNSETSNLKEGAWKLAYADFVTAMMCFFMLMWLLNATPSEKLRNMANYFSPSIGFFGDSHNNTEATKSTETRNDQNTNGDAIDSSELQSTLESIASQINRELPQYSQTIRTKIGKEGLEISVLDDNDSSMFERGSAELTDKAKILIRRITSSIKNTPYFVVIGGYTEKSDSNTSWRLSAKRADAAREVMQLSGLPQERLAKLVAYGDNVPVDNDPNSPKNRRITITLMPRSSATEYKMPISKVALSVND